MSPSDGRRSREKSKGTSWYSWIGPLLIITLVVALLQSLIIGPSPDDVEYGAFKKLARDNKVKKVRVGRSELIGELTEAAAKEKAAAEGKPASSTPNAKFRVPRVGVQNDDTLIPLLEEKGIDYAADEEPSALKVAMMWFLPMLFLMLLLYFLVVKRLGPGGSAMTFGRSRAKLYAQEDLNVSFDDVAGIDEAVEELREVVDFLKTPQKYQAVGGRIPKGVLLVGPPGTGKTLLAKAVAGEAGVPFFGLSGSDFVEMFVGVGAARVRDLFAQGEQFAPCIIFIDELDALGKVRGNGLLGSHDEREQTLNQLLVEMDGFDSNRGVIIMAATNRPETLDPALLRPGRFDRTVVVDRPDVAGREAILKVHIRNVKVAEDLDLRKIAGLTPGFVGADLANLINEAALLAGREGRPHVGLKNIEEAIERGVAGLKRKQRIMMPDEKRRIAYHECGHAIVAYLLPGSDPVHKISIIPRGVGALGYTLQMPLDDRYLATQTQLENKIATLLGGISAEEIFFPDTSTGAHNDLERVTQLARSMVMEYGMSARLGRLNYSDRESAAFLRGSGMPTANAHSEATADVIDQEVRRIVDAGGQLARGILEQHREALVALAEKLLEREVLDANELKEIMDASGPHIVPGTMPTNPPKPPVADLRRPEAGATPA